MPRELTSFREVVKQVLPGVVSIEARGRAPLRDRQGGVGDPRVPPELRRYFEDIQPQQFDGGPQRKGFGSGVLIDPRGIILTNNHVVDGADEVIVQLKDGRKFTSKDIKTDAKSDLAIVRLKVLGDSGNLPFLQLGDSDRMEIGDRVLAVGAPFGLTGSVTAGIISGKGRSLRLNMYEDFLQTDAAINPGNSGGPLISLDGKVIGINAAIKSRTGGFQGVGLAVSSNLAQDVMKKLLKDGVVKRGYLGVQIQDVSDDALAEKLGLPKGQRGVVVTRTFKGAPAAKAGIKEGDVITAIGDHNITDGREVQRAVADLPLDKPVKFRIIRDGQARVAEVVIEEQPEEPGAPRGSAPRAPERKDSTVNLEKLGIAAIDLTPELAERLGYDESAKGAVVVRVEPGTPAGEAHLARGMLISTVDRKPVDSASALASAVEKASLSKGILLRVQSPEGGTSYVLLKVSAE
jgi:serine protease Do